MKVQNIWRHYCTTTKHGHLIRRYCFEIGLYWQGLMYGLSKYGLEEFWAGIRYYQENHSPNVAERELVGYSRTWFHHKDRNRHHYGYWIDISNHKEGGSVENKMLLWYVTEMTCDRIVVCEVYKGKNYTSAALLRYYEYAKRYITIRPETRVLLGRLFIMLKEKGGNHTFAYLRKLLKEGTH